jgi:hypothetical protein
MDNVDQPKQGAKKISFSRNEGQQDNKPAPPPLQPRSLSSIPSQSKPAKPAAVPSAPPKATEKAPIIGVRPRPKGSSDFEAFCAQKQREKEVVTAHGNKAESHRHQRQKGMSGNGEQYQDHKLANAVAEHLRHDNDEEAKAYHNHRVSEATKKTFSHATDGQGKQLHDHRIGEGIRGNLDFSAGQGAKYQDHKLGKGFANLPAEEDNA